MPRLVSIIRGYVRQGTVIYSDCWRAYSPLSTLGYTTYQVNHLWIPVIQLFILKAPSAYGFEKVKNRRIGVGRGRGEYCAKEMKYILGTAE